MSKIREFFTKIMPTKRRLIQIYAALLYNANIKGFVTGKIFKGDSKAMCVPGMNCYSCPGAIGACPIGSLQAALADSGASWPAYVIGIILLEAVILGRTMCGWLCPAGLLQELAYKIKTPKLKKSKITRVLSYFKFVVLFVLVIGVPLFYGLYLNVSVPTFCKYICPVGTFEGSMFLLTNPANESLLSNLGQLFTWKFFVMVAIMVASVFIYRVFCRFLCPLGALFGLFNKFSILGVEVNEEKCNGCGKCVSECKMDTKRVGDHECIMCGECKNSCANHAIDFKNILKQIRAEKAGEITPEETTVKENKTVKILKNVILPIVMIAFLIGVIVVVNFIL